MCSQLGWTSPTLYWAPLTEPTDEDTGHLLKHPCGVVTFLPTCSGELVTAANWFASENVVSQSYKDILQNPQEGFSCAPYDSDCPNSVSSVFRPLEKCRWNHRKSLPPSVVTSAFHVPRKCPCSWVLPNWSLISSAFSKSPFPWSMETTLTLQENYRN